MTACLSFPRQRESREAADGFALYPRFRAGEDRAGLYGTEAAR